MPLRHKLQLILKQSLTHKNTNLGNPCSYTHSPWSSSSLTSTFGLQQEQDFVLGHAQAARPSGMSASSQTCARDALFGHSQLTWLPGNIGRRLKSMSTVPCAHIPLSHPPREIQVPQVAPHPVLHPPCKETPSRRDGLEIHTHLAKIPLPE